MTKSDYLRRSRIAAGIGIVLAIMLLETRNVDKIMPSPYSPYVWALLGLGAAGCLGYAGWAKLKSNAVPDE